MTKKSKAIGILVFTILLFYSVNFAYAQSNPSPGAVAPSKGDNAPELINHKEARGKVVIIVADRTSIHDWYKMDTPNLNSLASKYSISLMNCKTGGSYTPESTFLTIGAGVPLHTSNTSSSAVESNKHLLDGLAGNIYKQRTGITPEDNSIVQLDIARIHKLNENSSYELGPGTLGKKLRDSGIITAVIGNSDSLKGQNRQAVSIAMDDLGIVDTGQIDKSILLEDPDFPGGIRTHYEQLLEKFKSLPENARFVVIDTGDFSRIEDAEQALFSSVISEVREKTAVRLDNFIGQVAGNLNMDEDLLMVVSPTPEGNTVDGKNLLTPVLVAGNGVNDGLLYSPATKRPGIIRNTDLTASILKFFQQEIPGELTGRPFQVMQGDYLLSSLVNLHEELAFNFEWRPPILKNYVLIQLLVLGASLIFIFWKKSIPPKILRPVLLAIMSVPLALLLLPAIIRPSPVWLLGGLFLLIFAITIISIIMGKWGRFAPFIFISGLTSLFIVIDLFLGAPMQKISLFGYDPVMGARFYGLGNEYMGVLIGSSIITVSSLLGTNKKFKKLITILGALYLGIVLYAIAAPHLGTNFGGTVSSAGAFLVTLLLIGEVKITPRTIGLVFLGILTIISGFILYDILRPSDQQSHIGQVASLLLAGNFNEVMNIITRKLSINIKLIRYTIWSRVFIGSLISLLILFYRPLGAMEMIKNKYPTLYKGFGGVITGAILALIFNDSGVVAAATAMIFGVYPLIYLILQETYERG